MKFDDVIADFKLDRISLVEHGPVKSVIRSESIFSNSHLIQDFTLFQGLDWVKVDVTVDWHEQQKMLKTALSNQCNRGGCHLRNSLRVYPTPHQWH